jgi:hypothetical protein
VGRSSSTDRRFLELKNGKWRVTIAVPRELRHKLGTRLKRALRTDSLAVANGLKWQVISQLRAEIETARAISHQDPLNREALEMAARRAHAETGEEREHLDEAIRDRAQDIRGEPIGEEFDPFTSGPDYVFDAQRERQAEHYFALARGEATLIELNHDAFVAQSTTKARTKADDRRALRFLLKWCEQNQVKPILQSIDRRTAVRFMDGLAGVAGGQQPNTLNKYLNRLSRYWQWLLNRDHVESDPWAKLKIAAPTRKHDEEERPFSDDEVLTLLNGSAPEHMQDLMRIAALTGARLDAIVDLTVGNCHGGVFLFKGTRIGHQVAQRSLPRPCGVRSTA